MVESSCWEQKNILLTFPNPFRLQTGCLSPSTCTIPGCRSPGCRDRSPLDCSTRPTGSLFRRLRHLVRTRRSHRCPSRLLLRGRIRNWRTQSWTRPGCIRRGIQRIVHRSRIRCRSRRESATFRLKKGKDVKIRH